MMISSASSSDHWFKYYLQNMILPEICMEIDNFRIIFPDILFCQTSQVFLITHRHTSEKQKVGWRSISEIINKILLFESDQLQPQLIDAPGPHSVKRRGPHARTGPRSSTEIKSISFTQFIRNGQYFSNNPNKQLIYSTIDRNIFGG